jgi:hypothetical protein
MNARGIKGLMGGLVLLAPFLTATALAASDEQEAPSDQELSEILVEGMKPEREPQKVIDWMARLVGEFDYEGHVDVRGKGNPADTRPVRGTANCLGFGPAPAVQCEIKLRWTTVKGPDGEEILGGRSNLNPAMMLYGFEPDRIGIRYMTVDSEGIADGAMGYVIGNTLISRSPCVNVPGQCERVARITANPDLKMVRMEIDLEVDYQRAVRFEFIMKRVPGSKSVVVSGPKIFAEPESKPEAE